MGVKKNFGYNLILTVSSYIFPLITFPYVSRVLGVTKLGACSFVDSIINYYVLFAMMGLSATGIRAIAASNNDNHKQSNIFSSLLTLNAITTFLMLAILLISIEVVPQFSENRKLLYIGAVKLVSNLFLVEWFFKGTENFKWITQRTIYIKIAYVTSILLFVKKPEDYYIYYLLTVGIVFINAAFNFPYACKKIKLSFKGIQIKPHLKSFIVMGTYLILTSMYTTFNTMYLGMTSGDTEVGYYSFSTRLFSIILGIYTAFTGVMLPRMSALYANNNHDEFRNLIKKSLDLLLSLSIPIIVFATIFTPIIVDIVAGNGYEGAYIPTRIVMPLILIIGYEQILILQILMPAKQDKIILRNSIIGATIGVIANVLLVTHLKSIGSAIVWVAAEIAVLISAQISVSKLIGFKFPYKAILKTVLMYVPTTAILLFVYMYEDLNDIAKFSIALAVLGISMFIIKVYFEKDPYILKLLSVLKNKIK